MIADEVGVTKAAVYHQFNTKDEIVLAVAEVELARLDDGASTRPRPSRPGRGGARGAAVAGHLDWPSSDAGG